MGFSLTVTVEDITRKQHLDAMFTNVDGGHVQALIDQLVGLFGWPTHDLGGALVAYAIRNKRTGQVLYGAEPLREANLLHGDILVLAPVMKPPAPYDTKTVRPSAGATPTAPPPSYNSSPSSAPSLPEGTQAGMRRRDRDSR